MIKNRVAPSMPMFTVTSEGEVFGPSGRSLHPFLDKRGYKRVNAYYSDTKTWKQVFVHVLICEAFHGPRPPGGEVAHGDGDKTNNRADNLRWTTRWQNEHDKREHGTALLGIRHHQAKLSEDDVRQIRLRASRRELQKDLASEFGVSRATISSVVRRLTWAHLR